MSQSPVNPKDIAAANAAATRRAKEDQALAGLGTSGNGIGTSKPEGNGEGWDLSGKGSDKDDGPMPAEAPVETESAESNIPGPDPNSPTISGGQARKISKMLMERFNNDRAAAKAWLNNVCHVPKSTELRANQYELVRAALTTPNKEN